MCTGADYLPSLSLPERKRTEDPFFAGNVNYQAVSFGA